MDVFAVVQKDWLVTSIHWLTGAPGVGKSVVAWQAFLDASEGSIAYFDVDQVGMLYPDDEEDEFGFRLKNDAVREMLKNYASAGLDVVLISGVVDAAPGEGGHRLRLPGLRYLLLTVEDAVLRGRILDRGWDRSDAEEVVAEQAALLNVAFADQSIQTTGMPVPDVARMVLGDVARFADNAGGVSTEEVRDTSASPQRQVVVVGARASGCSTVGFGLARASWSTGVRTGFADLDQLSFCRTPYLASICNLELGLQNVIALRSVFATHGAERFVVNGHPRDAKQLDLLRAPSVDTLVVRLRASSDSIRSHIASRFGGDGAARLTGDDLAGATAEHQDQVRLQALRDQELMDEANIGDLVLDVDDATPDDLVATIAAAAWQ